MEKGVCLVITASIEWSNETDNAATKPSHLTCSMACKNEAPNCISMEEEIVTCFGTENMEMTIYSLSEEGDKHKSISLYVAL